VKKVLIALVVIGALVAAPVFASTITGATYVGTINIANVGTVASNVGFPVTISTSNLITQGFIDADCENTCIQIGGADVAYMPARTGQTEWMVFSPSIPVGTSSAKLYTGGADMGSKIRYFPAAGGMTTPDDPALELGDNFKIEQKVFVDTSAGASKYLAYKQDAIETTATAGNITTKIYSYFTPTGFVDAAAQWSNEGNTYDDNTATFAQDAVDATLGDTWSDFLELTHAAITTSSIRVWVNYDGATRKDIDVDAYYSAAWHDVYSGVANNLAWTDCPIGSEQTVTAMRFRQLLGTPAVANILLFEVDFQGSLSVSTAVATGEHTVTTTADGTDLKLYVDAVEVDSEPLVGASVIDNANNWAFLQNNSALYMESHKIYIPYDAADPEQSIAWENGATFTDLSGNGHTATPSFRTTTTDGDVTASLDIFTTNALSVAEGVVIGGGVALLPGAPDDADFPSGSAYDEGETGGLIIDELVNEGLATADIPEAIFWYPVAFVVAIAIGFGAYGLTKSLLVQAIVSAVVMAGFCGGGVLGDGLLPWFTVVIFGIEAAMLLIIQEKFSA
jgi:hypothetical protein